MVKECTVRVENVMDALFLRSIATSVSINSSASRISSFISAPPAGQPANLLPTILATHLRLYI